MLAISGDFRSQMPLDRTTVETKKVNKLSDTQTFFPKLERSKPEESNSVALQTCSRIIFRLNLSALTGFGGKRLSGVRSGRAQQTSSLKPVADDAR